ncbi:hypothetical protein [Micromonospora sp. ATCC 39149]|uniref:Uncharacterized protein n=1 Tax=Micromonospora carbonacea TaxID=47853 RepID=A0A7D6CFC6_9ACTN|nr:hypothetical protein [Micromonospora sp. ATCC 39149]QLK00329.1 hypothetical protein HZU44_09880 [Micromonospora carbonacea]
MHRLPYPIVSAALTVAALVAVAAAPPAVAAAPLHPRHGVDAGATAPGRAATAPGPVVGDQTQVMSVRGAGPFRIGADLARLSAAGLIDWTAPGCDGVVQAGVTGAWAGQIMLAFVGGRLVEIGTATVPPYSPAGAGVGMTFDELEEIYGPRGELITNNAGDESGYLVRYGSRVELFTGHPIRPGVGYFQVGPASFVERGFREGRPC